MYLQSIKSVKHNAAKSVNRSILEKSQHLVFGVFIVHSSLVMMQPAMLDFSGDGRLNKFTLLYISMLELLEAGS